ncbi:MAG: metallophosphoesterase [Anaerolineae bacterium]
MPDSWPRVQSLDAGMVMVVGDLHGDWDAYRRYRDTFLSLRAGGQADCWVLLGDLVHRESSPEADRSLEIVLDVMALRDELPEAIIYLCGNHEVPHIYGFSLAKGRYEYSSRFEAALGQHRDDVIALFDSLPFYVRTRAGVAITHAGAPAEIVEPGNAPRLFNWSHRDLLEKADRILATQDVAALRRAYGRLNGLPYEKLARHYLAVSGPDDPRYNDLLRGFIATEFNDEFGLVWAALFNRCEHDYGRVDYAIFLDALLAELSRQFSPQEFLVAGHVRIKGGHQIVVDRHLRLASATNANPREAGEYLLFDAGQPVRSMRSLLKGLRRGFT